MGQSISSGDYSWNRLLKWAAGFLLCACLVLLAPLPAWAATQIRLFDLTYQDCPAEIGAGAVTPGGTTLRANCYLIIGQAENKSGRTVVDADVFGRIYDANGNPVMQNRTRLGAIEEVPPGISEFQIRVSVPYDQPTPLILEQFKASGFTTKVR
ncbi:hypothetical protein L3556_08910 [Candidatus Synechococcus calcipolaris G9]|uniref:Biotin carboxylase n=1 Tax=Candidatus Synechococcus calcipolaris G9 TaxID=1497997 RepID=A0ABT6EZP0_9SYNE|nr:hypothetical protein [Candidatus Synechococcus calcipolaris]MDG2991043.1 hypothetical protein [Candidatus Synechococcus calcipolaris G9]